VSEPARCRGCLYWVQKKNTKGLCRRFPPTVVHVPRWGDETAWPRLSADDWCGEWKDKTKHTLHEDELPNLEHLST